MTAQFIISHPGNAHFDDVTAISLILAAHADTEFRVERREPLESEIDDAYVWIVDIGNRHEPEKRNFDHHQSLDCPASFVLVADYLGLAESMSVMPWWHFKDEVDRFGPVKSSAKYQAGDYLVNSSPVESWLMNRFVAEPEASLPMLKTFGRHLIEEASILKKQIDFWNSCPRIVIAGLPAVIGETRESAGLEEFRRLAENKPDIVISLDRRDDGWRLFRYDGTPVDFSLIADRAEIAFSHKGGFLAKTKERLSIEELSALVGKAVIRPSGMRGKDGPDKGITPFDSQMLVDLVSMRIPFGKYKGRIICDLPEPYLVWFHRKGFPPGNIGILLSAVYEIKLNGLEYLLKPIRNRQP